MRFIIADTFTRSLARLDQKYQHQVKSAAFDFQVDPSNPGFHFHRLDRAVDKDFWSFRVTSDVRIIVHKTDSDFVLCYAAHHDPAYEWAQSRRLERHPTTGAAQLVEVVERTQEVVKVKRKASEPPVFEGLEDAFLLRLGVPEEWIEAVKSARSADVEDVLGRLPAEAGERLLQVACGEPVSPPAPLPGGDLFEHPDAQRRFRVVEADELRQALAAPWSQWIVFLHPSQRSAVERTNKGPARVSGGAGTGKTVVALHRTARLLRRGTGKVLLTTFSRTLALRLRQHMDLLLPESETKQDKLDIDNLHRVASGIWSRMTGKAFAAATDKDVLAILEDARTRLGVSTGLDFLVSEWESVVDPWGIRNWQRYRSTPRTGRNAPLSREERAGIWRVFEEVWRELERRELRTWNQLCHEAAELVRDAPPYQHVIVDEAQDFGPAELTLARALAANGPDDLFLCSDAGQRIYKSSFPWSAAGIDIRGRSTRLKVNYRTTEQIRRYADSLVPKALEEGEGVREDRGTISMLSGPDPELGMFGTREEERKGLVQWLRRQIKEGFQARDIAIFARIDAVIRERVEPALKDAGLKAHRLNDEHQLEAGAVAVGSMHRAKGLEFRAVAVVGCEEGLLPLKRALADGTEPQDFEDIIERERQLLYVATTRARERLLVTAVGTASRFLVKDDPSSQGRGEQRDG